MANKTNWWVIVAVTVVIAVVASLMTVSLTGNVIKVNPDKKGQNVYTQTNIEACSVRTDIHDNNQSCATFCNKNKKGCLSGQVLFGILGDTPTDIVLGCKDIPNNIVSELVNFSQVGDVDTVCICC